MSRETEFLRKLKRGTRSPEISQSGAWTNYSATSTVTGWASTTTKVIKYKKVGKTVRVLFNIAGTSNNTATTFTLPYAAVDVIPIFHRAQDNGGANVLGYGAVNANATVTLYSTVGGAAWTASGTKTVIGEFWYEATA